MNPEDVLRHVESRMRLVRVTATRSVKTRAGESAVTFEAVLGSESGSDMGVDVRDARVAAYVLSMTADVAAYEAAVAGGGLPQQTAADLIRGVRANYMRLISEALQDPDGGGEAAGR